MVSVQEVYQVVLWGEGHTTGKRRHWAVRRSQYKSSPILWGVLNLGWPFRALYPKLEIRTGLGTFQIYLFKQSYWMDIWATDVHFLMDLVWLNISAVVWKCCFIAVDPPWVYLVFTGTPLGNLCGGHSASSLELLSPWVAAAARALSSCSETCHSVSIRSGNPLGKSGTDLKLTNKFCNGIS